MMQNQILLHKRRIVSSKLDNIIDDNTTKVDTPFFLFRKLTSLGYSRSVLLASKEKSRQQFSYTCRFPRKIQSEDSSLLKERKKVQSTDGNLSNRQKILHNKSLSTSLKRNNYPLDYNEPSDDTPSGKRTTNTPVNSGITSRYTMYSSNNYDTLEHKKHSEDIDYKKNFKKLPDDCLICKYENILTNNVLPKFAQKRIAQILANLSEQKSSTNGHITIVDKNDSSTHISINRINHKADIIVHK